MNPHWLDFLRDHLFTLPVLAKFALGMVMIVAIPRLCHRLHVPAAVGLLLGGVIIGPYVLGFFGTDRPIADFLAELGKLLLMFFAGLEIDLALFGRARNRSIAFGITTTVLPLVLGTAVGLTFGYTVIPAIVIGSLLASHTLLVGKWIAAWVVGRTFGYSRDEQLTVWSLTLPQVVATLAATLVAHDTLGATGHRLLDDRMLNVVLVLVLVTAILGPVLTEHFTLRLVAGVRRTVSTHKPFDRPSREV